MINALSPTLNNEIPWRKSDQTGQAYEQDKEPNDLINSLRKKAKEFPGISCFFLK